MTLPVKTFHHVFCPLCKKELGSEDIEEATLAAASHSCQTGSNSFVPGDSNLRAYNADEPILGPILADPPGRNILDSTKKEGPDWPS